MECRAVSRDHAGRGLGLRALDDGLCERIRFGQWRAARRLSLAESAQCADGKALAEARNQRLQGIWQETARRTGRVGHGSAAVAGESAWSGAGRRGRPLLASARRAVAQGSPERLTLAASHLMQAARLLIARWIGA